MQCARVRHSLAAVLLISVACSPTTFASPPGTHIQSWCGADPDGNTVCTNPGPNVLPPRHESQRS